MTYDPFGRGQYPVGVQSLELTDSERDGRRLAVELWYPAADRHRGHDLARETQDEYAVFGSFYVRQDAVRGAEAADGVFPLVLFSHGMAGHRRQSTFLCTHFASHGYVVLAPDHGGSTLADLAALALRVSPGHVPSDVEAMLAEYVKDRPSDLDFIIRAALSGQLRLPTSIADLGVGVAGHSFGGFSALAVASRNDSVRTVLALAPAGGAGPLAAEALTRELKLDFEGRVKSLYLALERDSLLPVAGIEALYRSTPDPKRMFVLPHADHMHFCDRAESSHEFFRKMPRVGLLAELISVIPPFDELVPSEHGYDFARALGLAQLDAALRGRADAEAFLGESVLTAFTERGIEIRQV